MGMMSTPSKTPLMSVAGKVTPWLPGSSAQSMRRGAPPGAVGSISTVVMAQLAMGALE